MEEKYTIEEMDMIGEYMGLPICPKCSHCWASEHMIFDEESKNVICKACYEKLDGLDWIRNHI